MEDVRWGGKRKVKTGAYHIQSYFLVSYNEVFVILRENIRKNKQNKMKNMPHRLCPVLL